MEGNGEYKWEGEGMDAEQLIDKLLLNLID